jgi:hypothetical protein
MGTGFINKILSHLGYSGMYICEVTVNKIQNQKSINGHQIGPELDCPR